MDRVSQEYVDRIRALLESSDTVALDAELESLHPADIADVLQELPDPQRIAVLKRLDVERAAGVLTEIDEHSGQALLQLLTDHEVVSLVEEMPSDDAADFMSTLSPETTERVEALLSAEGRQQLRGLMGFHEESAGGIMEAEFVAVIETATIDEAIEVVRERADEVENVQKVYVVNDAGQLTGVLRVIDLIVHPRSSSVREHMVTNVISVPVDMDQEQVAAMFGKYDEFALPVVDGDNRLVGRITVDDIIDVIEEEASEDIAHIAGTTEDEIGEPSVFKVSRTRLPWLVAGLLGELFNAFMMDGYQVTLRAFVTLVFFVPLIVATAGNTGMQGAIVVVRELALGEIDVLDTTRRVFKELAVGLLNGVVLGAVLFTVVVLWLRDAGLGALLWGSLMSVMIVAAFVGSAVPLVLQRWRIDPAIATGPFITVLNDIIGLAIYLSLARVYLSHLA
jgi:magnesium transporter